MVNVTHSFVSGKSDSSDATLIQPSNWNADHEVSDSSGILVTVDQDFTAQAPGGSLTSGITNTVTLTPVPKGINGTNLNHYLYISGGSGTAEVVLITGGTAVSEATSGTVTFVPANSHSGAWTIASASAGLLECLWSLAASGGIILFPPGTHTVRCQIRIPNDGTSPPRQKPFALWGSGCLFDGNGGAPNGGSIVDMTYSGTGGKLTGLGYGALVMRDLTLKDSSVSNTTPFVYLTNTTPFFERVGFYGSVSGASTTQDAIILGGTTTTRDGSLNAPYGGYGGAITNCYFNRVRRIVYGRVYCNGMSLINPTVWNGCGGSAAVELDGNSGLTEACDGWKIWGGTYEVENYTKVILLTRATHCTLVGIDFYDPSGTTTHLIHITANSYFNTVIAGTFTAGGPLYLTDDNTLTNYQTADSNLTVATIPVLKIIAELQGIVPVRVTSTDTSLLLSATQVVMSWRNKSNTNNNYTTLECISYAGVIAGAIGFKFTDHTNGYGQWHFATTGASGFGVRFFIDSDGKIGLNTTSPTVSGTGKLHSAGDTARITDASRTPANSAAAGNDGEICYDSNYIYVHTGGSWRRTAIATF